MEKELRDAGNTKGRKEEEAAHTKVRERLRNRRYIKELKEGLKTGRNDDDTCENGRSIRWMEKLMSRGKDHERIKRKHRSSGITENQDKVKKIIHLLKGQK